MKKQKPAKKPQPKEPPVNVKGVGFEEGLRIMLNAPPLRGSAKQRKRS